MVHIVRHICFDNSDYAISMQNDIEYTYSNSTFKGNTPLNTLESSILACIGLTLLEKDPEKLNTMHLALRISGSKIHIECECKPEDKEMFITVVKDCYLCKIVNLEKVIHFFHSTDIVEDVRL